MPQCVDQIYQMIDRVAGLFKGIAGEFFIGMGEIDKDMFIYALTNLPWINICLFVNDDFRECFCDAVMIEKALLQVSRREYLEFRDEMTMDGDSDLPAASIAVNFASFSQEIDSAIGTLIAQGYTLLVGSGTHEAYAA
mgnify:CR=1 FL=1